MLQKRLLKVAGLLLLVGCLFLIALITFINPTKFKQVLEKQLAQQTGQIVHIQGPVRWRLLPLCLEVQHLTLKSPAPFLQDLLSIQQLQFFPHLRSCLGGKLLFDVKASLFTLNLNRMSSGTNNWQSLLSNLSRSKTRGFLLTRFTLEKGLINLQDNLQNRQYSLHHLDFSSEPLIKAITQKSTAIQLAFIAEDNHRPFKVKVDFKTNLKQLRDQTLEFRDCNLQTRLNNQSPTTVSGSFRVADIFQDSPRIEGNLIAQHLDSNEWVRQFFKPVIDLPFIDTLSAQFYYQDPWIEVPAFALEAREHGRFEGNIKMNPDTDLRILQLHAALYGKTLKVGPLNLQQFKTQIALNDRVITVAPIEFQLANGKHESSLQMDYRGHQPKFSLTYASDHVDIHSLLKTLKVDTLIDGQMKIKTNLSTMGEHVKQWRQYLAGQAEVQVAGGNLYGIDLLYLLKHAQSTLKSLIMDQNQSRVPEVLSSEFKEWERQAQSGYQFLTPFEVAKASVLISNGILNNPDLSIQHPQYNIEGKGSIDLTKEMLTFQTNVHYHETPLNVPEEVALLLQEKPLSIQIQGDLRNPVVIPDLESYTQFALQSSQKYLFESFPDKTAESPSN